jgi:hypothetical protein
VRSRRTADGQDERLGGRTIVITPLGKRLAASAFAGMLAELAGCSAEPPPVVPETVVLKSPPLLQVAGPPDPEVEARERAERAQRLAAGRPASPPCWAEKHRCKAMNDCKGMGGCKTDDHACKGLNDCKGRGGCKTADCAGAPR